MSAALKAHPAEAPADRPNRAALLRKLFAPVDAGGLAYFRVIYGLIVLAWVIYYFRGGYIDRLYIDPSMRFTWPGFSWVKPWPGAGMRGHFLVMGVLAAFVVAGFLYRVCALLLALAISQLFLIDKTNYQNHYYLMTLVSWLMVLVPANRAASLDAVQRAARGPSTVPAWSIWLLRFQVGVPYFFGGIAKIDSDWLQGQPMRMVLSGKGWYPVIGQYFTEEWMVQCFVWGGLLFDLLVVPGLLWRRTRPFAFAVALMFHLLNATLFHIGIFPWFMMLATVVFFPPDWPSRMFGHARRAANAAAVPSLTFRQRLFAGLLTAYVGMQVVVPLRYHLYDGNVNWTERGHYFSWHMLLRGKKCAVRVFVTDSDTNKTVIANMRNYLTVTQAVRMAREPEMLRVFAHRVAADFRAQGVRNPRVYVIALVSLNGRKPQLMIDPNVDLASEAFSLRRPDWILRQTEPLSHDHFDASLPQWEQHVQLPKLPFESQQAYEKRTSGPQARRSDASLVNR